MDEDCPPGAEGYEDSVTQKTSKKPIEDSCTKAEHEFQEHLNSLKIKLENGETKPMVERRGRDLSGKWIYLCFPCGAMCSGETVLQTHISGKKHKTKLALRSVWSNSIFDEHPYVMHEKGNTTKADTSDKVLQKMAEEVDLHNKPPSEMDLKYNKYREVRCHIQDTIDVVKAPLLGVEYLIEHPPEQAHYEPSYICVLCSKHGHPRTIMNHMTCFWHRYNYLTRHFAKASALLAPFRGQNKYREGVYVIMNRLAQRIEDKYGRLRPVNIDKEEYDKDKELIHQWLFKSKHFSEQMGPTFEEVVDADLISSLHKSSEESAKLRNKDPSPPIVAAPTKPNYRRADRRNSEELSDISDEHNPRRPPFRDDRHKDRHEPRADARFRPYEDRRRDEPLPFRSRFAVRNAPDKGKGPDKDKSRPPNYEYKMKLADEKRKSAEDSARKTLAYHEKNPEKHPLYPEEWKKFWNRRYKEIQAEGKDASKHDFKPEWIVFWTTRMKELHDEELRININEIYRKLCLSPPNLSRRSEPRRKSIEPSRKSPDLRRHSPELRRRSPELRRRSPDMRRRSPDMRRRSPDMRRRSLEMRRRSPDMRRRSPDPRRPLPERRRSPPPDYRRERSLRSSERRRHSPPIRHLRTRSRSPVPQPRARSPARTHIALDSLRRSRSPLSRRGEASRNRSPAPHHGPSSQTVMISDDELHTEEVSPWNSDNDIESLGSLPDAKSPAPARSHTGSAASARAPRWQQREYGGRSADPQDLGPAENVVATLRLLVALEDYLGSLGPKVVDLMTEALKMEKDKPNSSEDLLERETAVVLMETAKEKLKGAMQAGLVPPAAQQALRAAVVRAASTLHEADTRAKRKQQQSSSKQTAASAPAVTVAGVGDVDRAQIAQQMAAALIAQGKTDVSSEELAQLVDAVVGMAEAKKREAVIKKKQETRALADKASRPPAAAVKSASASALQMLQSAYDENDKKVEKEDVPDAMDGLSDSDLETLLKNFNELSAEEQHSLIAYLKKMEAKEPQRVERLRQYVSAAATSAPPAREEPPPPPPPPQQEESKTVTIESDDDDDYTVEDVFKSVNQKVKEDQIRQEMEIVKKSLETKAPPVEAGLAPSLDVVKNMSSAAGLLALVQASIQAGAPVALADVVSSATQLRSFGDAPPAAPDRHEPQLNPAPPAPFNNQGYRPPPSNLGSNQSNFGGQSQTDFGGRKGNFDGPNQGNFDGSNQGNFDGPNQSNFDGPNQSNFDGPNQGNRDGPNQGNFDEPNQGNFGGSNQGNYGGQNQGNFGGSTQGSFGGSTQGSFGGSTQGSFGGSTQGNFGGPSQRNFGGPNQGNFGGPNQGNFGGPNQGNFGGPNQGNFGAPNQGNFGGPNQGNFGGANQGFGGSNQGNLGGNRNYPNQNISPWEKDNVINNDKMMDNRGPLVHQPPGFDNYGAAGQDQYNNQGPRGNYMNGRMQDNCDTRPMNQPFGNQGNNFQGNNFQGNNFRGRGGGRGNFRGRGRGYY